MNAITMTLMQKNKCTDTNNYNDTNAKKINAITITITVIQIIRI